MNKKYLLIGAIGLVAVYFIYKKFVAKKESSENVKNDNESPIIPLALKQKPSLKESPFGNIIAENTKPQYTAMESAMSLENKYNNAYC